MCVCRDDEYYLGTTCRLLDPSWKMSWNGKYTAGVMLYQLSDTINCNEHHQLYLKDLLATRHEFHRSSVTCETGYSSGRTFKRRLHSTCLCRPDIPRDSTTRHRAKHILEKTRQSVVCYNLFQYQRKTKTVSGKEKKQENHLNHERPRIPRRRHPARPQHRRQGLP